MNLSKSKYCKGMQCPKILWMEKNMPECFDEGVLDVARLEAGNVVGDLAMGYFGEFTEVPYADNKTEMLARTKELIDAGTQIITEASFAYEGNFCSVDILLNDEDGVRIVEVKSSGEFKPEYADDMAYQYYVLSHCGLVVKSVSLMHLNKEYVRQGELDLQELYTVEDHTEEVRAMQEDIPANIERIRAVVQLGEEPLISIGCHCKLPHECGFRRHCWRDVPENSIFDLSRMPLKTASEYYHQGVASFADVLCAGIELSAKQQKQVMATLENSLPLIELAEIQGYLESLRYPLYFLDFETYQQPIPLWDNVSPWMQIPFQYSLHIQAEPGVEPVHIEFLAEEGYDPRRALAERLCQDIPGDVCVLAYHMSFEQQQIKGLAGLFPDLAEHLMAIHENMVDLETPFRIGAYYDRGFGKSSSIKVVLPVLCPDDPELDYSALALIHNGNDAMGAYADLHERPPEEREQMRSALLAYCRLDTLAMVKILEKLQEIKGLR